MARPSQRRADPDRRCSTSGGAFGDVALLVALVHVDPVTRLNAAMTLLSAKKWPKPLPYAHDALARQSLSRGNRPWLLTAHRCRQTATQPALPPRTAPKSRRNQCNQIASLRLQVLEHNGWELEPQAKTGRIALAKTRLRQFNSATAFGRRSAWPPRMYAFHPAGIAYSVGIPPPPRLVNTQLLVLRRCQATLASRAARLRWSQSDDDSKPFQQGP